MILDELKQAVMDGDQEELEVLCNRVIEEKLNPVDAVQNGLIKGIEELGRLWSEGEMFLPDVMMGADALQFALDILGPELAKAEAAGVKRETKGKIVIGTVKGDIHDIGKNIVSAMLTAAGYDVHDLGIDQDVETFVEKAEEVDADVIGLSALLTTTMPEQKKLVEYLQEKGLRDKYKVIIGGGPTTNDWTQEIGADGWAETAAGAIADYKETIPTDTQICFFAGILQIAPCENGVNTGHTHTRALLHRICATWAAINWAAGPTDCMVEHIGKGDPALLKSSCIDISNIITNNIYPLLVCLKS
jgi:trimethylamine corrinoid protein